MRKLIAGLVTAACIFSGITTSHADEIVNLAGTCTASNISPLEELNRLNGILRAQQIRVSRITSAACIPTHAGTTLSKVYIRAHDGRQMIWEPSQGTDDLQRMMLRGR